VKISLSMNLHQTCDQTAMCIPHVTSVVFLIVDFGASLEGIPTMPLLPLREFPYGDSDTMK
jgi:hypothetical protein